ncbi:MAG: lysoplasmalogenase family protein [Christensenellales bacterium]|jgi:hypothetical protein
MKLFDFRKLNQGGAAVLALLYGLFLTLDILGIRPEVSVAAKYAGICICFLMACARLFVTGFSRDGQLVALALGLTLAADTFLLWTEVFVWGVVVFCGVQAVYARRFGAHWGFAALGITLFAALALLGTLPLLFAVVAVYACLFVGNMVAVFCSEQCLSPRMVRRSRVGMVLFFLCDINVMLYNLLPPQETYLPGILMWLFYLPGQYFLSTSADGDGERV